MEKKTNAKIIDCYFSHDADARRDKKTLRLRKVLGAEGYGIYWMLIETLREQPDYKFPLEDVDLLESEFGVSKEKIEAVIKQFKLFTVDDSASFFSLSLIYRMQPMLEKSEKMRELANRRWDKVRELQKQCDSNAHAMHSKLNESKLNEKRLDYISVSAPLSISEIKDYAETKNCSEDFAHKFYKHYENNGWTSKDGKIIKNWKNLFNWWIENEMTKEDEKTDLSNIEKNYNSWRDVFGSLPLIVEKGFIRELSDKFDIELVRRIFYNFRENGFKKVATMRSALNAKGELIPKPKPWDKATPNKLVDGYEIIDV